MQTVSFEEKKFDGLQKNVTACITGNCMLYNFFNLLFLNRRCQMCSKDRGSWELLLKNCYNIIKIDLPKRFCSKTFHWIVSIFLTSSYINFWYFDDVIDLVCITTISFKILCGSSPLVSKGSVRICFLKITFRLIIFTQYSATQLKL